VKKLLIYIFILLASKTFSQDLYNPSTNQLTIPSVNVGNTNYINVVITVGNVISVGASSPIITSKAAGAWQQSATSTPVCIGVGCGTSFIPAPETTTTTFFVKPNNSFYVMTTKGYYPSSFGVGQGSNNGNSFTGSMLTYNDNWISGTTQTLNLNMSNGLVVGSGLNASTLLGYNYSQLPNISAFAGSWTGGFLGNLQAIFNIGSDGSISGQMTNTNCKFTGNAVTDTTGINVIDLTVNFGASCPSANTTVSGIGLIYNTFASVGSNPTLNLLIELQNSTNTFGTMFYAQK